jgi:hypothetical protein
MDEAANAQQSTASPPKSPFDQRGLTAETLPLGNFHTNGFFPGAASDLSLPAAELSKAPAWMERIGG